MINIELDDSIRCSEGEEVAGLGMHCESSNLQGFSIFEFVTEGAIISDANLVQDIVGTKRGKIAT